MPMGRTLAVVRLQAMINNRSRYRSKVELPSFSAPAEMPNAFPKESAQTRS